MQPKTKSKIEIEKLADKKEENVMAENTELMTVDNICNRVYIIRGQQVIFEVANCDFTLVK